MYRARVSTRPGTAQEFVRTNGTHEAATARPRLLGVMHNRISAQAQLVTRGAPASTSMPSPNGRIFIHTSVVLQRLYEAAPIDYFTLGWVMASLRKRSFGMIMLLLSLAAVVPGVSIVAGLLLMIPAFQMIAGRSAPVFPRRIANHQLPTRHLVALVRRAVPLLGYIEKMIHPRWQTPLEATKRLVGMVVIILDALIVLAPIPLTNVVPALVIALISLAYLEEDGLLLLMALLAAIAVLAVASVAVWETVRGVANWAGAVL
jgi:hypothetical protein